MRIVDSTNLGNTLPAQTSRTGELRSKDPTDKTSSTPQKASSGTDSVEFSGFADRLSRTMQTAVASRAQRVTELTEAVRSGSYRVNAEGVSRALVNQAISPDRTGTQ